MQSADIRASRRTSSINDSEFDLDQEEGYQRSITYKRDIIDDTAQFNDALLENMDMNALNDLSLNDRRLSHHESVVTAEEEEEEDEEPQLPSATADAMETYENIISNVYCGSATGKSIAEESMPCECKYRPELDNPDAACGDDNYCINRMMFMECMQDDCPCGRYCRNRRFQLRQYARVDVIRTELKGFGLRALTDLPSNAFIMEYIGEVIPNREFIRRTKEYEADGLEHYYFMTLKTDEIIDATKKGCLARFINHSCNPNSVTQKWVVGKNMRIGIFTRRPIKAGSELTFDYKFERYGAVAQRCYCGEANCKGFIGGASKNVESKETAPFINNDIDDHEDDDSISSSSASSSDDEEEDQDELEAVTLTQKRMIKRMHRPSISEPLHHPSEVQSFVKKMLDSVGKSHLVNKLLLRLELTNDTPQGNEILKKFIRLHGLKMLKFWLSEWKNDKEIIKKVLFVLSQLPLANKNGLEDSKMFDVVDKVKASDNLEISEMAEQLIDKWNNLKSVYRIPKRAPPTSSNANTDTDNDSGDKDSEMLSSEKAALLPPRFESSREFFDPDDDLFEYFTMYSDPDEIQWKTEFPPRSAIPTAPRAMINACIKNGFFGYGRPTRLSTPAYAYQSSDIEMTEASIPTHPAMATATIATTNTTATNTNTSIATTSTTTASVHDNNNNIITTTANMSSNNNNSNINNYYNQQKYMDIQQQAPPSAPASSYITNTYYESSVTGSPANSVSNFGAVSTPPKLPTHWRSAYSPDGTIYYYHKITGKTQWHFPQEEERASSIEGVASRSDLQDLVERAIQDTEQKKSVVNSVSPQVQTPSSSRRGSSEMPSLDETELKKEIGKVVTKYLSTKKTDLWKGDKYLFKELARKITHHIVDRETQSSRKIHAMNSNVRSKIEKFIDAHGSNLVSKMSRKKTTKHVSDTKTTTDSPASSLFEESVYPKEEEVEEVEEKQPSSSPPHAPAAFYNNTDYPIKDDETTGDRRETYHRHNRRENSPYDREKFYVDVSRYSSPGDYRSNRYYSPYYRYQGYRSRYYPSRRSSPGYYSSRRPPPPTLSDDEMDRRRWD
ncbi:hypothetical protein K501DRAFT_218017 [Backusella circina FSU 941]|nr:hypothetical protein K501DRAFT_218017 [Backusella circina FSU 941]